MEQEKIILKLISLLLNPFIKDFFKNIENNKEVLKLINLYKENKFTKIRFWDAPFIETEQLIPLKGTIIDLGCGEGIFTNYMALKSFQRQVLGIDIDKNRIKIANKGLKNTKFIYRDANKFDPPRAKIFIMFHLLHHLKSKKDQEDLIDKCLKRLEKGGMLVIVEVDKNCSFKYWLAWLTDHIIVALLFEKKIYEKNINFRTKTDWLNLLRDRNLKVKLIDMSPKKPFSHITMLAQR